MNKKKRKEPLVDDSVKTLPSKKKDKYTVWIYGSPFGFTDSVWLDGIGKFVYKLTRKPPTWRVYDRYPTYKGAMNAIQDRINKDKAYNNSRQDAELPFYWIGDTPPVNE